MIRANLIQQALLHLIGWQQDYDTTELAIADSLTKSESGLYYQQVHPLITLQNLRCIAPDFKNTEYPEYSITEQYSIGNIVQVDGTLYKAIQQSIGKEPATSPTHWEVTNPFSDWLENKTKASIQKAISRFYTEKLVQGTAKAICEHKTLFEGAGRISDTIANKSNLVGLEIVPIRSNGVTVKINKIGLQFTAPGPYKLYLMHSSMDVPVRVIEVDKIRKNSIEWFSFDDLYLPYQSEDNDAGGSWYICYFQSDLPEGSMAIRKQRDWSKEPCKSCSRGEYQAWQIWSRYLEVHPFYVNEEQVQAVVFNDDFNDDFAKPIHLWDIEKNIYTYDSNYGINLEITVECDFTDFIIGQKTLFQDIIAKQTAIDLLRELVYNANVRTNRHSINASRADILYELDGDSSSMKQSGLSYQLDMAYKAITLNTRGIDRVCQPCNNKGIKYRVI